MNHRVLYVGVDAHEKESQLAVMEGKGSLLLEERIPTRNLSRFLSSLLGEKRVAIESVGFIHPIYERLSSNRDCEVFAANPNKPRLIAESSTTSTGSLTRSTLVPILVSSPGWTRVRTSLVVGTSPRRERSG